MITQQAARRRRGRAIRKRRRLHIAPPPLALVAAFQTVLDHIRRAWAQIQDAFKAVGLSSLLAPLTRKSASPRPLIHNGRKPR